MLLFPYISKKKFYLPLCVVCNSAIYSELLECEYGPGAGVSLAIETPNLDMQLRTSKTREIEGDGAETLILDALIGETCGDDDVLQEPLIASRPVTSTMSTLTWSESLLRNKKSAEQQRPIDLLLQNSSIRHFN